MSGKNGLLILGDHLFLNCKKHGRRLVNNGMLINPDLTLHHHTSVPIHGPPISPSGWTLLPQIAECAKTSEYLETRLEAQW